MTKGKVLVIDDEDKLRNLLTRLISFEGYDVIEAENCKTALSKIEKHDVDVVLCDVKLPDGNGVDLISKLKTKSPFSEIIMLTAYGNIPDGVQAIKNGAFDYITKGDDNNRIIPLIIRAIEKADLAKRVQVLEKQLKSRFSFENIIGNSKAIKEAIELARKVAPNDTSVLLTGETGTGKEIFAQSIHQASKRSHKNFIAINCSAFSKDILESEMFGHKAGAFTGAIKEQKGLFEEANNGTLFLDEIGEMPLELQSKFLRVLESGEFIKIGDNKPQKVNVRIIAATNRNLQEEIKKGNFREDLFYRLSVFQINIPSLQERGNDIELLAEYFTQIYATKNDKKIVSLSKDYLKTLKLHNWHGNTRELKNIIERSVILCSSEELTIDTLPIDLIKNLPEADNKKTYSEFDLALTEKEHIKKVLNYTNGNKTETARLLNIALSTLYRKLSEYKIG